MKKVLRRVVVCGLLGLVTSIVVAYVAPMLQYHPWLDGHTHDALIVNGYRVNRSASFGKTSLILGDAGDGPGVMIPPDAARSARDVARTVVTTGLSPGQFAQVVQQGLPLRCVEAWHAPTQTWGVWVPGRRGVFLPLRPIPLGIAVDTVIYGSAWAIVGFNARRRRRLGFCPKCGYPRTGSAVCSECGTLIRSQAALPTGE